MKSENAVLDSEKNEKFKQIYEQYGRLMKYIAIKTIGSQTLAEDAVQNAFIKILRFIDKIEDINSPKCRAFVVLATENCCKDIKKIEIRQKIKQIKLFSQGEKSNGFDYESVEAKDFALKINEIPEKYKTVLMLRFYYDMSYDEIAEMLGTTNQNVRKRIERARKIAIQILNEGADDDENN